MTEEEIRAALTLAQARYSTKMNPRRCCVMAEVDKLLECHGVELIRDPEVWDSYWGDTIALYVNTGDTYCLTLIYDIRRNCYLVESWGDWVERMENENESG